MLEIGLRFTVSFLRGLLESVVATIYDILLSHYTNFDIHVGKKMVERVEMSLVLADLRK